MLRIVWKSVLKNDQNINALFLFFSLKKYIVYFELPAWNVFEYIYLKEN